MSLLKKIFAPETVGLVQVEIVEACLVNGKTLNPGDVVQLDRKSAETLVADRRAVDVKSDTARLADLQRLQALLPPPVQKRPMPDSWKALPAAFSAWWKLYEGYRALKVRADEIERALIATAQRNRMNLDLTSIQRNAGSVSNVDKLCMAVVGAIEIGQPDMEKIRELRHLSDALQRAEKARLQWLDDHGDEVTKVHVICGDSVMDLHGELCKNVRELGEVAFDIFASRIGPLGLAASEVRRLFNGSADSVKYAHQKPTLDDLRVGWVDDAGPRLYVDKPCPTLATMHQDFTGQLADARAKLKSAKSELAKTRKLA